MLQILAGNYNYGLDNGSQESSHVHSSHSGLSAELQRKADSFHRKNLIKDIDNKYI